MKSIEHYADILAISPEYKDRSELPKIGGVYFIYDNGKLVYIGQSKQIHKRAIEGRTISDTVAVKIIPCDDAMERREVETAFLLVLKPPQNNRFPGINPTVNPGWCIPASLVDKIDDITSSRNVGLPRYFPRWTPSLVVAEILSKWQEPNP